MEIAVSIEHGAREIIRFPRVKIMSGKSRTQLWRDMKAGLFPASIQIGPNATGWYLDEVVEWQKALARRTQPTSTDEEAEARASP